MDEEANPFAVLEMAAYRRDFLDEKKAEHDPLSYEINHVLLSYIDSVKPAPKVAKRKTKLRTWKGKKNYAAHLMNSFEGWTLRDIDIDTGRYYYADRLSKPLYKGERKDADNPKDSPVRKELYLLRKAIKWFVAKKPLRRTPSEFEMPDFSRQERDFFTYGEMMAILWACLGFCAADGWKRTVHIPTATSEWLVRFFVLYFLTGTRYANNSLLFWGLNDEVGCIDADNGVIWRYGRKEIVSKTKPKRRSDLLPLMQRIVRRWYRLDLLRSQKMNIPFGLVIHDENGDPPKNLVKTVLAVLVRAGLEGKTAHMAKHAGVTLLAELGYTARDLAETFGNEEKSLRQHYLHIDWEKIERRQAERLPVNRFNDLGMRSPKTLPQEQAKILTAKLRASGRLNS